MNIDEIRNLYLEARESAKQADAFYQQLEVNDRENGLILAYWASAQALKAKHMFNPFSKLALLQKAAQNFKQAIENNPNDIEMRFLRYTVEVNTPSFVNLSQHLVEDKELILERFEHFDKSNKMYPVMVDFFFSS